MSDNADEKEDPLDNSIEKLETIIDDKEEEIYSGNIPILNERAESEPEQVNDPNLNIPVLDELVTDEPNEETESEVVEQASYSSDQLMQLVDKLEDKLNGELEMLINVIKGNMKDTIVEEIRSQMDIFPQQSEQLPEIPVEDDIPQEDNGPKLHSDGYRPYGHGEDI